MEHKLPLSINAIDNGSVKTAVNNNLDPNLIKYQGLFEATPISLWEEDFSLVKQHIDHLRQQGITNFRVYFDNHLEEVTHCINLVRVINVNQATLQMYKAESKEELLENLRIVFGTKAFDNFKEELILISNGNTQFESEGTNYTLDGDPLDVFISWSVSPGFEDSLAKVMISILDITKRKKVENQLRWQLKEEALLRKVVALTAINNDLTTTLTSVCQEMAQFFEVPKSAFALLDKKQNQSQVIAEYCAPDHPTSIGRTFTLANNNSMKLMLENKKPLAVNDAQHDPIMAGAHDTMRQLGIQSILLIPVMIGGKVVGSLGVDFIEPKQFSAHDISISETVADQISIVLQRQKAEREMQEQHDLAHQVMDSMGQGLVLAQTDWTIDYCNPALAELLGMDPQDIIGKSALDLVYNADPRLVEVIHKRWLSGKTQAREIPLQHADGSMVHTLLSAVPRWRDGKVDGAIAVVTDLAQQKAIEKELATARDQAIETSRHKSEFLANMSHEIRTPLNAIIGMTGLMLDTSLTSEQQDFAETIRSSGDVLLSLINDILDFSKIEAGKLELENQPFDLRDCVEGALDVVVTKAAEKGLEMAYEIDTQVPPAIVGDVTRLRQVLVNLLNNAIKFTEKGEVILSVTRNPASKTKGNLEHDECSLHFSIQDTGIGIPEDRRNRLFRSFSQVDASTTRKHGGSGLGLAISKHLVELMGGSIWVDSEVEKGSTFHFTIQTKSGSNHRRIFLRRKQPQLVGKRLLIVDDNQTNRLILTKQARLWGMEPLSAASGPEALTWIKEGKLFDVAVLDMQMPEMDGLTLGGAIRLHRDENNLPLVMLSSVGSREKREEVDHFAAFLTKPVKPLQLFDTLTSLFDNTAVLPRSKPKQRQIDPEMGLKHPLRILLAEDNLVNQKVALRILERMGYNADLAATGLEVLEALQRQVYDVVLMDVQMPDMDGVEATQQIRDIWPKEQQPHIIAMTAHALIGDREKYIKAGMDDYISKPVRIQELLQSLANSQPLGS